MDNMQFQFGNLNLQDKHVITMLLLGETGVGKTTFINSLANYLRYENFKDAINSPPLICASTTVSLLNEKFDTVSMVVGPPGQESQNIVAPGTLNVKDYVFPLEGGRRWLRLIDSPGIGDPKGTDQDDTNIEKIFSYLLELKNINGICFLLKPTTTRSNALFEYCLKQFLSRLEISASRNLIFVFTNTRSTYYTPGETLPCLRKIIEDIKLKRPHVDLPFTNENIFCMDNEGFKYLAVMARNVKLQQKVLDSAHDSWKVSVRECKRLISYIDKLEPHQISNTIGIHNCRNLIIQHSQVLFDVSQMIDDNVSILKKIKFDLQTEDKNLDELKRKLCVPIETVEMVQLPNPVIVCTSKNCTTRKKVNGKFVPIYTQICQDPPEFKKTFFSKWGTQRIKDLFIIRGNNCTECGCHFATHKIVESLRSVGEKNIIDNNVKQKLTTKEELFAKICETVKNIDQEMKEQEAERDNIVVSIAKFTNFLQVNSITPVMDMFKENIGELIFNEKSLGLQADWMKQINLEKMLQKYEKAKSSFSQESVSIKSSVADIEETINRLYNLKHNGFKIKELVNNQQVSIARLKGDHSSSRLTSSVQVKYDKSEVSNEMPIKPDVVAKLPNNSNNQFPHFKQSNRQDETVKSSSSTDRSAKRVLTKEAPNTDKVSNTAKQTSDFSQYVNMDAEQQFSQAYNQPLLTHYSNLWPRLPSTVQFNYPMSPFENPYLHSHYAASYAEYGFPDARSFHTTFGQHFESNFDTSRQQHEALKKSEEREKHFEGTWK